MTRVESLNLEVDGFLFTIRIMEHNGPGRIIEPSSGPEVPVLQEEPVEVAPVFPGVQRACLFPHEGLEPAELRFHVALSLT